MRLDPAAVRQQLDNLKLIYPDLVEDDEAWDITLSSETDLDTILDQIVDRMRHAEAMAGGCASRIAETELRQARYERQQKAMRDLAFKLMESANVRKRELAEATLSITNGRPKVVVVDEAVIPDTLCSFARSPNKKAIKEQLDAGFNVPGCVLSNAAPSLSVRAK